MNYLILIADIDEFNPCKESLGSLVKKEYTLKHMPAFDFMYNGHSCTCVCFGIGKVNAAMGASIALCEKEYDGVINTGWSGAVSGVVKGDIIVSDSVVECDFDLTPIGRLPGQKPGQTEYIYECKNALYDAAVSIEGFKHGNLGTGDFFLTDAERKNKYKEIFNISAFDMESGALGAVCYLLGDIPFISIRKISDSADDVGVEDYKDSVKTDITAFSDIILKTLEKL
ncbi:MAG: 5'-methylthioadenosine/S-adenosylhomocysteine nucleosidase [Clostridia bacterium]|nr:5'-methylthioadenosine/S-adenosylhomocysteine nucleosidase [Clostridia bacterium]